METKKSGWHMVCFILVVIGALNWGLVGAGMLFGSMHDMSWNVVHMILGSWPMVEGIVYLLVGIAGICKLFGCKGHKKSMPAGMSSGAQM